MREILKVIPGAVPTPIDRLMKGPKREESDGDSEEEPEKITAIMSNGDEWEIVPHEEDGPPRNTRSKKRKTISARVHAGGFV